jgi:hypothetical protein
LYSFEEKFRYDEQGLPRVWKPQDDIDAHFKRAKDDVRNVLFETFLFTNCIYLLDLKTYKTIL